MDFLIISSNFALLVLMIIPGAQQYYEPRPSFPRYEEVGGCAIQTNGGRMEVFVTISSIAYISETSEIFTRQLELNWHGDVVRPGDKVNLYNSDPAKSPSLKSMVTVFPAYYKDSYFRTNVQLPYIFYNITEALMHPYHCLGVWAAYLSEDRLVHSSCLQIRPFWMYQNMKFLEGQKLFDIMIPGTHDSGSFSKFLDNTDILMKFKYAQEESISNQLLYGIRYFDLRVGFYNKTKEKFFINHSFLKTQHSVPAILSHVRSFLELTQEVVILDFHLFPVGFDDPSVHLELLKLIYNKLGKYMIPYNKAFINATMGKLWASGKRVLVSYNDETRELEPHGVMWPAILRAWGDVQHPNDLKSYFDYVFSVKAPSDILWASMAELTPNSVFIFRHPLSGLRILADQINRNVTRWFRDQYSQKANIVATDYFLGNNIIEVSIEANRMRYYCKTKRTSWQAVVSN